MKNVFIVIPTIRSLDFLKDWGEEFKGCHLIVVEDNPEPTVEIPGKDTFSGTDHFSWYDIKKEFGPDEWIFSRRNAGIRSYGFWKAHQTGAEVVVTLDDDCFPVKHGYIKDHLENLASRAPNHWYTTFPHPEYMYTRGFPYDVREKHQTVISHGLWSNKMDLDAQTQISTNNVNMKPYPPMRQHVPFGYFFPMSSMNLAFVRDVIPLMYFPLMGAGPDGRPWGYDRFDDIWAGLFAKKLCDHLGLAVVNGSPFVEHRKASDPGKNLIKEKSGRELNEKLWSSVNDVRLRSDSVIGCYKELAKAVGFPETPYFNSLRRAMGLWINLFS